MARALPSGTVTLLFTDVEGSTKLLHEFGEERYAAALLEHRRLLRAAFVRHGGTEVDTEGDAFFVAFPDASEALAAAHEAQEALANGPIRVRMGLHTGTPHVTTQGYVGVDVHKGARIAAAAHGGQIVLSQETRSVLDERFTLTDLGEHRVKDFAEPVWLYQLGAARFPPLKTISNTNLPHPASSFVGRDREVAEVGALLRDGSRLVTLTGPGGTGKTRLALEAAAELMPSFKNGVFWVPLAALRDPTLVSDTIGQTLGAKDDLAVFIGERQMLLLLDNVEQLTAAAPELASLVETCPGLCLLITSRERLRVQGEVEYAVPPLSDTEAVELFCARAQLPADETILTLCRRLDDLPLAVELAAARTSVLTPVQITARLAKRLDLLRGGRDADARQATLRATIEWSHELLNSTEQALFARLSVFRGGFTLEAAEAVCDADLDVLASLVDKSLLRKADPRFAMLETIREFAAERLASSGAAEEIRRRHGGFYLAMAEEAYLDLLGSPGAWLDRLEQDHDNLRAALDRFEATGAIQDALRLGGALYRFWAMRGHFAEGGRRLQRLLAAGLDPTAAREHSLLGAAVMASALGDTATIRARAEEALSLARSLGDGWGIAYATNLLANAAGGEKDYVRALPLYEEARAAFRAIGDTHHELVASIGLAHAYGELGDLARERAEHEETLKRARASGNDRMTARALYSLSWHALMDHQPRQSIAMVMEALPTYRQLREVAEVAMGLRRLAWAHAAEGHAAIAVQLFSKAEVLREDTGAATEDWVARTDEQTVGVARRELDAEALAAAWDRGRKLSLDEAVALARH